MIYGGPWSLRQTQWKSYLRRRFRGVFHGIVLQLDSLISSRTASHLPNRSVAGVQSFFFARYVLYRLESVWSCTRFILPSVRVCHACLPNSVAQDSHIDKTVTATRLACCPWEILMVLEVRPLNRWSITSLIRVHRRVEFWYYSVGQERQPRPRMKIVVDPSHSASRLGQHRLTIVVIFCLFLLGRHGTSNLGLNESPPYPFGRPSNERPTWKYLRDRRC